MSTTLLFRLYEISEKTMSNTLLSVDLDWLNGSGDPLGELTNLLKYIPNNIPSTMTIEHHDFLPTMSKWIRTGKVAKPFNVLNIDQHHDYYLNLPPDDPEGDGINCGVWGYRMPLDWYDRYTWVNGSDPQFADWEYAEEWLRDRGIRYSERQHHRLHKLKSNIVAAVFCISPDYLDKETGDIIGEAVTLVVDHFGMQTAPQPRNGINILSLSAWEIK